MKRFRFFLVLALALLCGCLPATVEDVVVFDASRGFPDAWLGVYEYIPAKGERFDKPGLPELTLCKGDASGGVSAVLHHGAEVYGGECIASRVPDTSLHVLAFPEFVVQAGDHRELVKRVFFVVRRVDDVLYVWDVLAGTLGPAPWHVDKVKKFLQKKPNTFDITKPGLRFRAAS